MVTEKPRTMEQLRAALNDDEQRKSLMEDPDNFHAFIKDYVDEALKDGDLQRQERSQHEESLLDLLRANGYAKRVPEGESEEKNEEPDEDAPIGAQLDGKFRNLRSFLKAMHPTTIQRQGMHDAFKNVETKDMSEGIGADGGFLVPEEFRAELLSMSLEQSVVRSRARVIPMGSASVRIPAIRDASHASTVFGGVSASWIAEAASLSTVTQPTFAQVLLTARKLTGYTVASNELLSDSAVSVESLINTLFPEAIAYFEDDAFINGTGAGQPLGIINADAMVTVSAETGQSASTIVWENIVNMYSRMMPQSLQRAVWVVHNDTFPQLATMSLNVGTGGSAIWLNNGVAGPPMTILGRPVVVTEKAQTLGTAGDIMFLDFGQYLIGDRQALTMAVSPHVNFTTDEMTWRFVQRVDGRPWVQTALTPRNGSNTLSPFVNLATRS